MFWKVYQWVWMRAQKSAAKEIIAYSTARFPDPDPDWKFSNDKKKQREYYIATECRYRVMEFMAMVEQEFEVNRQRKGLNLLSFRKDLNIAEEEVKDEI